MKIQSNSQPTEQKEKETNLDIEIKQEQILLNKESVLTDNQNNITIEKEKN